MSLSEFKDNVNKILKEHQYPSLWYRDNYLYLSSILEKVYNNNKHEEFIKILENILKNNSNVLSVAAVFNVIYYMIQYDINKNTFPFHVLQFYVYFCKHYNKKIDLTDDEINNLYKAYYTPTWRQNKRIVIKYYDIFTKPMTENEIRKTIRRLKHIEKL